MKANFTIGGRLAGFAVTAVAPGENGWVCQRELLGPAEPHLTDRLEKLHDAVFARIPGLPLPSQIDHIVVVIHRDLSAVAFVNDLKTKAKIKTKRAVQAGEAIFARDIEDILSVELGVDVPADAGVIVFRTFGWKRSVFYDLTPIGPGDPTRTEDLSAVLAKQTLLLLGLPIAGAEGMSLPTRAEYMAKGLAELENLLSARCEEEARYQELLERHPWILGYTYSKVSRHKAFDDTAIPDFTALRCYDDCNDIIELKQPFLTLFKESGQFASAFNDAWNQAEQYVIYTSRNRGYLLQEKKLRFEDPRCLLICGQGLSDDQLQKIREKGQLSPTIRVITYDQLRGIAQHVLDLVRTAGDQDVSQLAG